ncbi:MAG TPA: extracellular solute-binding protein [Actinomycetota bacterium]|nr:extracellular solute-binding protein [Actinomycetota bacterium]
MDIDQVINERISRRSLLKRGGILAGAAIGMPAILAACAPDAPAPPSGGTEPTPIDTSNIEGSTIKVGTYGGFFEENFREMYPAFTEEFGVEVESVSQPTSEVWVTQLQQAIAAGGAPPADVSMLSGVGLQRAINGEILATYKTSDIPTSENLAEGYVRTDGDDNVTGVGGLSWYITLVSNTDRVKESPDTWTAFWDPQWENELALLRNAANSFLLEITAASYFDGYDILETQDGVLEVMRKLQEVKPNVKLWFRDESQGQPAYNEGEVSLGQFYHDITLFAASEAGGGAPLRSVFPTEGAILDSGFWSISKTTEEIGACVTFIDYMCRPEVQQELALTLGTIPSTKRETLDMSDEDYEVVAGPGPEMALRPKYEMYDKWEDWIDQNWTELILS